jgi:hypothetical protein
MPTKAQLEREVEDLKAALRTVRSAGVYRRDGEVYVALPFTREEEQVIWAEARDAVSDVCTEFPEDKVCSTIVDGPRRSAFSLPRTPYIVIEFSWDREDGSTLHRVFRAAKINETAAKVVTVVRDPAEQTVGSYLIRFDLRDGGFIECPVSEFSDPAIEAAREAAEDAGHVLSIDPRTEFPSFTVYGPDGCELGGG